MSLPWGDDAGGVDAVPLKPLLGVRLALRSGWADAISIAEASLAGSRLRVISRLECCSELLQVKDVYVRHITSQIYNRSGNVIQRVMFIRISRGHFMETMEHQPKLAQALLGALCARLRVLTDQVEAIALFPLDARLARLFLQLISVTGSSGPFARVRRTSRKRSWRRSSWRAGRK